MAIARELLLLLERHEAVDREEFTEINAKLEKIREFLQAHHTELMLLVQRHERLAADATPVVQSAEAMRVRVLAIAEHLDTLGVEMRAIQEQTQHESETLTSKCVDELARLATQRVSMETARLDARTKIKIQWITSGLGLLAGVAALVARLLNW